MASNTRRNGPSDTVSRTVMDAVEMAFNVLDASIAHASEIHMAQGFAAEMGHDIAAQAAQVEALGLPEVLEDFADAVHLLARHTADDCLTVENPHGPELIPLVAEAVAMLDSARPIAPPMAQPLIDGLVADLAEMPRVIAASATRFLALEEAFDELSRQALRLSNRLADGGMEEDEDAEAGADSGDIAFADAEDEIEVPQIVVLSPEDIALMSDMPAPIAEALQDLFRANARLLADAEPFKRGLEDLQALDMRLAERHAASQALEQHLEERAAAAAEAEAAAAAAAAASQAAALQERERLSVDGAGKPRRRGSRSSVPVTRPL